MYEGPLARARGFLNHCKKKGGNRVEQVVRVEEIYKRRGRKKILKGAGFTAEQGQCVGIIGLNGSGKSTLLSILAGVQRAGKGRAFFYDVDVLKDKKAQGKLGYVPQENPLITDLTVEDNLKLWYCDDLKKMKKELEEGFLHLLELDGILKMPVKKLSGGMKKRVSIGISMWADPKVLMLDEPCAALDLEAKKTIREYLLQYRKQGGTVILVTHDEDDLNLCDKLYVLKDGKLKEAEVTLRGDALLKEML